jgi:hypothetical protein
MSSFMSKVINLLKWFYSSHDSSVLCMNVLPSLFHSHFAWLAKLVRKSFQKGTLRVGLLVGHHRVSRSINKWVIYFTFYIINIVYKNC